ncbi:bis-aminopropyl spermidine synthase family protein [Amycolatopsis sp. FDAARGOS 1241]|uniref:bis-aminopropyl spermidine synthase family protein n=1 Tax=Amycolatopsis sp. FDAARGOS 1241 TaxID=2778070 RepID=UPI00194E37E8|nr:bis-aminopropyl spermidine synthase family protein [Amycolatopsis sp. FDAARGOS 1241]QRP47311.1 bis-aminopropyl spermidine synthase family protein [Amycolatopsis sp. FDAARGOS 1241]
MTALDDVLAAHGAGVRPLYEVIDLLRTGPRELADLVRLSAAPRRSVEDVLMALEADLERSAAGVRISPDALPAYETYRLPRLPDPLDDAVAAHPDLLAELATQIAAVPAPLAALDHVQATPETVLRRALWLSARYDLRRSRLLFLGDHDLTSLAVRAVCPEAELTVVDLDERVLSYLDATSGRTITLAHTDLRIGLPPAVAGRADLVFSDPPYTPEGMGLFAARAVQALREPTEGRVLLAYGYSPRHPALGAQVQRSLATLGLTFEAILPDFNRYAGAQAVGSAADLYVCQPTAKAKKSGGRKGKAAIYTHGPQSVEASGTKPALLSALREIATEGGLALETRPVDWSASGPEGDAVAMDLTADPGPWLLRTLLGTNARRLALLVPNNHPDLTDAAAQTALTDLVAAKYRLRFLRSTPDNRHAIVTADAVEHPSEILTRAHARLANVALDVPAELTDLRLVDVPRHRLVELLDR